MATDCWATGQGITLEVQKLPPQWGALHWKTTQGRVDTDRGSPKQKLCLLPTWLWPDHAACFYQREMDQEISPGKGHRQGLWGTLPRCWARSPHVFWRVAKGCLYPHCIQQECQIVRSSEDWWNPAACKWKVQLYWFLGWIYWNVKNERH